MKLITETIQDVKYVTEAAEDGKKSLFIVGPYMVAEEKNRNGRVYSRNILEGAVKKYMQNYVKEGRAFGELGHPEGPTVNLDKVSHLIKDLSFSGNVCEGKAKILTNTPMGKIASSLIEEGAKLGVSSRGMGSLREFQGVNHVQEDFMLAAVDIVADPSAPGAFVNGIMENKEWIWDNGIIKEKTIFEYKKIMNNTSKKELEEKQLKIFEHFLSKISKL
jgi:hypothetical protein